MTRLAILFALVQLAACFQSHPDGQRELAGKDCYGCHAADYTATAAPVHRDAPQTFSTTCVNCHRTVSWQPALEGAHNEAFITVTGAHAQIACQDCHDLAAAQPSKLGANTNCIQCHPNDARQIEAHAGVTSVANTPYAYLSDVPSFCLQCHPAGLADRHPDDKFALRGDHAVPCAQCHDRSAGKDSKGANVTCVESRCHHTVGEVDGGEGHTGSDYVNARGNGNSRNFCHQCHT